MTAACSDKILSIRTFVSCLHEKEQDKTVVKFLSQCLGISPYNATSSCEFHGVTDVGGVQLQC